MHTLLTTIASAIFAIGSFFGFHAPVSPSNAPTFGSYNPTGGGTYRLQSSIGSSDTSLTLSSFTEPVSGLKYTMTYLSSSIEYGTIEPQSSTKEFISFTGITQNADGSATLTGVTRGLSFSYPYTASTTFQQAHPSQSIFILSNPPQLTNQYVNKNNDETITGTLSGPEPTANSNFATKNYVDTHVNGGTVSTDHVSVAGTAGETFATGTPIYLNKSDARWYKAGTSIVGTTDDGLIGIAQGAGTAGNTISGGVNLKGLDTTNIGLSIGTNLFVSSVAGATTTATSSVPLGRVVSSTSFYLDPHFMPSQKYTTTLSIPGTSSNKLTINGLPYVYPSVQNASSTVMLNDGSGNLSWNQYGRLLTASSTAMSISGNASTTLYSGSVPANSLGTRNAVQLQMYALQLGNNASQFQIEIGYGGSTTTVPIYAKSATQDVNYLLFSNSSNSSQKTMLNAGTSTISYSSQTLSVDSTQSQPLIVIGRLIGAGDSYVYPGFSLTKLLTY